MVRAAGGANAEISGGGTAGQSGLFYHVLELRNDFPGGIGRATADGCACGMGIGPVSPAGKKGDPDRLYRADADALSGADASPVFGAAEAQSAGHPGSRDFARHFFHIPRLSSASVFQSDPPGNPGGCPAGRRGGASDLLPNCPSFGGSGDFVGVHPDLFGFLEYDRAAHDLSENQVPVAIVPVPAGDRDGGHGHGLRCGAADADSGTAAVFQL